MVKFDVCIIGGGAAGLMASIFAAQAGAKTAIIEKNSTLGRKLLRTGHSRCNLTHTGSIDDFVREYDFCGRFLKHSLYEFSPQAVLDFFAQKGLATKTEKDGSVFPITDRATDVCRILNDTARRATVSQHLGRTVETIEKGYGGQFIVKAGTDLFEADALIIATGGLSWPQTGSTGDGLTFAKSLGHAIVQPKAALAPVCTLETWTAQLKGIGIPAVRISAVVKGQKLNPAGPLMFTEDGLGGPAILDLSRSIADVMSETAEGLPITLDLLPSKDSRQLEEFILAGCAAHPKQEIARVITELLPRAVTLYLVRQIQPDGRPIMANQLAKDARKTLITLIKEMPMHIKAIRPLAEATITRGGVCFDEIEPTTMQSKLCPGLFFAGEVINADGPCGGYNLQIAWSTGALAGKSAVKLIKNK